MSFGALTPMSATLNYAALFGFTFMGVELFGFNTSGSYETLLNKQPPPTTYVKRHEHRDRPTPPTVVGRPRGITIRVIDD